MSIVEINKNDLITTSLSIAKGVGNHHKNVLDLIRTYENDLNEFGIIAFETRKSRRGKPTEFCYLNEPQTYFLLTLMRNNEQVTKFKKELVKEFMRMRKALMQLQITRQSEEWKIKREQSKLSRLEVTDAIKEFVEYATNQGSQNAKMYYSNLTKMEYKSLFLLEQKFPNLKDFLNHKQLSSLETADHIVEETLKEGMDLQMNYKDIYQLAKKRVEELANLIKPSIVISIDEIKLLK